MADFSYHTQEFAFQTVFHRSTIDYCCCPCSYEHELVDYISEDGEINEEMYSRVLENIVNGKCPHVDEVPTEYVTETTVMGIHIAAVVGPLRAVKKYRHNYFYKRGKVFEMDPCQLAVLKNKDEYVSLFESAQVMGCRLCNSNSVWKRSLLYGLRTKGITNRIQVQYVSMVELSARRNNLSMFNDVLNSQTAHNPLDLARVLELTFENNLSALQRTLFKYLGKGNRRVLVNCAVSALVYDQPAVLARILGLIARNKPEEGSCAVLSDICSVLNRPKCVESLSTYELNKLRQKQSADDYLDIYMKTLIRLTETFPARIKDEPKYHFKQALHHVNIDGSPEYRQLSFLNVFLNSHSKWSSRYTDTNPRFRDKLNFLFTLGADIDNKEDGTTPLTRLLSDKTLSYLTRRYRELLEWLIYDNSSLDLNTSVVNLGFKHDAEKRKSYEYERKGQRFPETYIMDAKTHLLYGHDDAASCALNFIGPLLIECGYPVTKDELEETLESLSLHPAEYEYIQQTMDSPRPLQLFCRDRIRKHFKGRELHKFVEAANIPKHIGEFILLKPILRNIVIPED